MAAAKSELEDKITDSEYDDTEVRGLISGNAGEISAIKGEQTTQNNAIKSLEDSLKEGGATAEAIADAKKAGTDAAAALSAYETENDAALAGVNTTAEKGVADAATAQAAAEAAQGAADAAQDAADAAQQTANAAIPAPTGQCTNPTNKCVLTYNNSIYEWEVIERNGEGE